MAARVLVVGAGAIGGVTAARLATAGVDVTILDANAEHVARMRQPGLRLDDLGEERVVPLQAYASVDELPGHYDYALIFTKALAIEPALQPLRERELVDTYVPFGNGLVQDRVAAVVGAERMFVGIVEWGATNLGPGHVARTTDAPFVLGERDGRDSDRVNDLAAELIKAGDVRVSDNIEGQVWAKLVLNTTFSGLGTVAGQTFAEMIAQPGAVDLSLAVWTEGCDVAAAVGVQLDEVAHMQPARLIVRGPEDRPAAVEALDELMARLGPTKASMLQDLERGARTEVDVINGGLVARAEELGVPAPLNTAIARLIRECENGERRPDPGNLQELTALLG